MLTHGHTHMYHTSTPPVLSVQRLQTDLAALNATLLAVVGRSVRVGVCVCAWIEVPQRSVTPARSL